jgi:hypothetical protein
MESSFPCPAKSKADARDAFSLFPVGYMWKCFFRGRNGIFVSPVRGKFFPDQSGFPTLLILFLDV